MLNRGLLYLLIAALALLAAPALARPVAAQPTIVVDDDSSNCVDGSPPDYSTITAAIAAAGNGDTIRVCEGDYTEPTLQINNGLTITGSGRDVTHVHYSGTGLGLVFYVSPGVDTVVIQGLDIDAMPSGTNTSGIASHGTSVSIEDNEIRNGTLAGVLADGRYTRVIGNNIHNSSSGVELGSIGNPCNDCVVSGNTVNLAGGTAIEVFGNNGNITSNVVVNGKVNAEGDDLFVSANQISAGTANSALSVAGERIGITDNSLSDAIWNGIEVSQRSGGGSTSATISRNTFTDVGTGIVVHDLLPADAFTVTATIGGSSGKGNTFVNSGGSLGDLRYLVEMGGPTPDVDAEYNNWGLCTLAEIAQEIHDHADDPALGVVDYDPFIAPDSCSAATPTPTPTPTPAPTATPIPGGTRTVTIPAASWANFAWTGDSSPQTVANCFGEGNISVIYRLDAATQTYQRWISGRPDLSDMSDVQRYDALLALNASAQPATCNMPSELLPHSLTIPAGSWANFAWTGNSVFPAEGAANCFAQGNISVIYRLDPLTQTFDRWIRGHPDLSTLEAVQPYDALLALNSGDQPGSCEIPS